MTLIISSLIFLTLIIAYFSIKPMTKYHYKSVNDELILKRLFPFNRELIIQPQIIKRILIELLMDKPYAVNIMADKKIRLSKMPTLMTSFKRREDSRIR